MSHASCLVVTDFEPDENTLAPILQPWHEFECTGIDDQYVQEIDVTEETRKDYATHTKMMVRLTSGEMVYAYSDRFFRDPTPEEAKRIGPIAGTGFAGGVSFTSKDWGDGRGYRTKTHYIPEGAEEIQVPVADLESFADWACGWCGYKQLPTSDTTDLSKAHKYGFVQVDHKGRVTRIIRRTNPNKKWDWWQIGGRFSGLLRTTARHAEPCNTAMRADLDLFAMKAARSAERVGWVRKCCARAKRSQNEMSLALWVANGAHEAWLALPEPKPRGVEYHDWLAARGPNEALLADFSRANFSLPELAPGETLSNWLANPPALETWAMVLNGEWHEGARLLMFGARDGDRADWPQRFAELFDQIRSDQWLTVIDYHI